MGQKEIKVTWTKSARADLRKIHNFLAEKSETTTTKQIAKILEKSKVRKTGYLQAGQQESLLKGQLTEYQYLIQDHFKSFTA